VRAAAGSSVAVADDVAVPNSLAIIPDGGTLLW
jgi:sugar lactone lactonase YvrE